MTDENTEYGNEISWDYVWKNFYNSPEYKEWAEKVPKLEAEIERLKSLLAQLGV